MKVRESPPGRAPLHFADCWLRRQGKLMLVPQVAPWKMVCKIHPVMKGRDWQETQIQAWKFLY